MDVFSRIQTEEPKGGGPCRRQDARGLQWPPPGVVQRLKLVGLGLERPIPWVRQLLSAGAIIRWIGLGVVGIIGALAPPRAPALLIGLILVVGVYNAACMWSVSRADDGSILRIAQAITVMDELGCLFFIAIFTNLPGGTQIAFYVPMVVEAVAFGGIVGAGEALVVFGVGIVAVEWAQHAFFGGSFSWAVVLLWMLVMLVVAASIAALDQTLQAAPVPDLKAARSSAGAPASMPANLHLSPREREVLQLIAAGHSDGMIAARLHLSETTVKTHVGTLRTRLGAKTRAEAVAIASRLNLLDQGSG